MWTVTTGRGDDRRTSQHARWIRAMLRAVADFYLLYPEDFPVLAWVDPVDYAQHGDRGAQQ